MSGEAALPLLQRLWIYQAERFPLAKTAVLTFVFSAASLSVSAHLSQRPLPPLMAFLVAWLVTMLIFFQLRACDEVKDRADDARFRPERPVPRGLVTLGLIVRLGVLAGLAALTLVAAYNAALVWLLALVWLWLALMSAEFFVPEWLKARPFLYLVSHMAIMPLIDLFVTGAEWLPAHGAPPAGLGWFLGLSFINGCVLEIGRKVWAPENERPGVESYSLLLGPVRAAAAWLAVAVAAFGLLVGIGVAVGAPKTVALIGAACLAGVVHAAIGFIRNPTPAAQSRIDLMAGLWVLICYTAAGLGPWLVRM